jgi:hypothetical protein
MSEEKKNMPKLSALIAEDDPEIDYVETDEWYKAEFEDAEIGKGNFGPYIKLKFRLLEGQKESGESAKGVIITRLMDAVFSPSKPLWAWVKVFLEREPKIGEKLNLTAFYGNRYRAFVTDKKKKKGEESGKRYQIIEKIKGLKKKEPAKEEE